MSSSLRTSRASSTKTRIETWVHCSICFHFVSIKSKFHENKDWNIQPALILIHAVIIKSKFHENKDWNSYVLGSWYLYIHIKSKFHENKDWNDKPGTSEIVLTPHQEQVPRKQGLKPIDTLIFGAVPEHQEQVPRKQGLKQDVNPKPVKTISAIKSKFHENKDWNWIWNQWSQYKTNHQEQVPRKQGLKLLHQTLIQSWKCIKSKFHENKDWNVILNYLL